MINLMENLKLNVSVRELEELIVLADNYPVQGWNLVEWPYGNLDLSSQIISPKLYQLFEDIKGTIHTHGLVVIGLAKLIEMVPNKTSAAVTLLLLSTLGIPLRVFLRHPHWRQLGVDLNRPPSKSGGAGHNPLHMDFVNAENPPDLVCLLCLRSDPLGGGESLVAQISDIEHLLSTEEICALSRPQFIDGEVVALAGVGKDANPFPVLALTSPWKYRFTMHLIDSEQNGPAFEPLKKVATALESKTISFTLTHGDLLILDQHQVVHGRGAMGKGQEYILEDERRLLLLSYIRQNTPFNVLK